MAETNEPKKETVRIAIPVSQPVKPAEGRETVRITLPKRPPTSAPLPPANLPAGGAPRPPMAKTLIPPAPDKPVERPRFIPPPPGAVPAQSSAPTHSPVPPSATSPKKETARITVLPDPPKSAVSGIQMKKTQPLFDMPASLPPVAPIMTAASEPDSGPPPSQAIDEVPGLFYWAILGASAVVLIIQILNYIS
jgi:hypothetical protein